LANQSFGAELAPVLRPRWEWAKSRLGPRWVVNWQVFVVYVLLTELLRFTIIGPNVYNSVGDVFEDWVWLLLSRGVVFLAVWLALRLNPKDRLVPIQNLLAVPLMVCINFWLDRLYTPGDDALFRFGVPATFAFGALFAALGFALMAPLLVAIKNYRLGSIEADKSREQVRLQLEEIRFKERLAEEIRNSQLESIVIPQVTKLREMLAVSTIAGVGVVDKLRTIIEEHVRPLSASSQVERLRLEAPIVASTSSKYVRLVTAKKPVQDAIRPVAWMLIIAPIIFLGQYMIFQRVMAGYSLLSLVLWAALTSAIKTILGPKLKANGAVRALLAGAIAYFSWVPISFLVAYLVGQAQAFSILVITNIGTSFVYIGFFTLIRDFEASIQDNLDLIKEKNAELKRQVNQFNRNQWVAQRNWSYLLHGKIQASLSVALIKLSQEDKPSRKTITEVNKILDGIVDTLRDPKLTDVNTFESLDTLRQLWLGVCGVRFVLPTAVEEALQNDSNARFAIGEIVTEAVTNAVKHANASIVSIEFELLTPTMLSLRINNDGKRVDPDYTRSIGSKMMDDLTEAWSLVSIGAQTQLRADLQIAAK
jgi:signal transduction histidine kinase